MNNTQTNTDKKTISLIEGKFTPSQASDILNAMLDKKINYHKLQVMSITEGDHGNQCVHDNTRLDELMREKARLKEIIKDARQNNKRFSISSIINIDIID